MFLAKASQIVWLDFFWQIFCLAFYRPCCKSLDGFLPLPSSKEENDWLTDLGQTHLDVETGETLPVTCYIPFGKYLKNVYVK